MKLSKFFIPTQKELPADAVVASHILSLRAGLFRLLTSGVYSVLPLGLIVKNKVEKIVREEMNAIGGNEFLLPALSPNELWNETGRLDDFGDIIFRIKNRDLVLAPTHEEVFTSIAKPFMTSYKHLPQMWYQIQTKFRNEARPKSGVLRGRQFTMKDAYSFDATFEGLDVSYELQDKAYRNIFTRCGLKFFSVSASSGAMGGTKSEEFMIESEAGEDIVAISENGKYSSNIEVAESYVEPVGRLNSDLSYEDFHTQDIKSIEELAGFLGINDKSRLAKSRVFVVSGKDETEKNKYILALVCGDDDFNETKLQKIYGAGIRPGHPDELMEITGADAGSIGPVGLPGNNIEIIADFRLKDANELISGANRNDYHKKNIDLKRDVNGIKYYDIRIVKEGELTLDKDSKLRVSKAIEVGHIFKLGTKYSEALGARYLDNEGKDHPIVMGSYGIGIERIIASYIEQNHDDKGIIWGGEITPFSVMLLNVSPQKPEVTEYCNNIYNTLTEMKIEVLYDDREDLRPGFKFNDADLIGIPLQIIIGEKNFKNGNIEVKKRRTGERLMIGTDDAASKISDLINAG
jgi:prolyl-tRNA synthetase